MSEGGLQAPIRHPIAWQDPDFYDPEKVDAELHRVFDICHGCRRCFNLCDSFPRLFDLIDESKTGELDSVDPKDFKPVVEACTLCDMCFMTKCPYVPPHSFDLDFPHLMLRARAAEARKNAPPLADRELAKTDRNGKLAALVAPIANWATDTGNTTTRNLLSKAADLHPEAKLPTYTSKPFAAASKAPTVNRDAPAFGRKAVLYATCFVDYNDPAVGHAARAVLAHNGVETELAYPECCGMPQLELGNIARVAQAAAKVSADLKAWIDKGYKVIALVPSCALMLKFEWPLILPDDPNVALLARSTQDISQYIVDIAKTEGLTPGLTAIEGGVAVHLSCHSRAQNMGEKVAEMLRLLPDTDVKSIERCSGHGGSWGFRNANFETAMKVGKPAARQMKDAGMAHISSECPLAGAHLLQGIEKLAPDAPKPSLVRHPIQLLARAYGLTTP